MRGRGILVVEGLITRRTILNGVTSLPPWVVSTQVRALSTAQEKANTRAMLDRMLRFNLLYKCYMLQMIHNQCLALAGLYCVKNCHQQLFSRVDHAGEFGADRIYAGQMAVLGDTEVSSLVLVSNKLSIKFYLLVF